jgi:hypothetical protein
MLAVLVAEVPLAITVAVPVTMAVAAAQTFVAAAQPSQIALLWLAVAVV